MARKLTPTERWYYQHMGYSYPVQLTGNARAIRRERGRQARETAQAVTYWQEHGATWVWHDDGESFDPHGCDGGAPFCGWCPADATECQGHVQEGCVLQDEHGAHLASVWGIVDADADYRRVIEAELAVEAYYEHVEKPRETETFVARTFAL